MSGSIENRIGLHCWGRTEVLLNGGSLHQQTNKTFSGNVFLEMMQTHQDHHVPSCAC
eukprot:COSAG02_NODE_661_length_18757_cov_4.427699_2_plen_57_part_00